MRFSLHFDLANDDMQGHILDRAAESGFDTSLFAGEWFLEMERDFLPPTSGNFFFSFDDDEEGSVDFAISAIYDYQGEILVFVKLELCEGGPEGLHQVFQKYGWKRYTPNPDYLHVIAEVLFGRR